MKIKYIGHSCFTITSDEGTKIIVDPYMTGGPLTYGEIDESADIALVSHSHSDHNNISVVKGNPEIVAKAGDWQAKNIQIKGVPSYHDDVEGKRAGGNIIFCFDLGGFRLCHMGDIGHLLSDEQIANIGKVDILFIPVGGKFTINGPKASNICSQLNPRIVIPMHYESEKCKLGLDTVDKFTDLVPNVKTLDVSEIEVKRENLPSRTEVMVLKSAL